MVGSSSRPSSRRSVSVRPCGSTYAYDDVGAGLARRARGLEHRVRLADSGRCAKENSQSTAPRARLVALDRRQQSVRVRAGGVAHARAPRPAPGSVASTFTRGSPSTPNVRSWVCVGDDVAHAIGFHAARACHARDLILRGSQGNVRIEAAAGGSNEVHRHRVGVAGIRRAQSRDTQGDSFGERRIRGRLVGAGRSRAVVGLRTCGRRATPEVPRAGERLPEQGRSRPHGLRARSRCRPPGDGNAIRPMPVTTSGYATPVTRVSITKTPRHGRRIVSITLPQMIPNDASSTSISLDADERNERCRRGRRPAGCGAAGARRRLRACARPAGRVAPAPR